MWIFLTQRQKPSCVNVMLVKIIKVQTEQHCRVFLRKLQEWFFFFFWVSELNSAKKAERRKWTTQTSTRVSDKPQTVLPPGGVEMGHSGRAGRSRRFDEWTSCKHQQLHWKTSGVDATTKYRSGLRRNAPALETDVCETPGRRDTFNSQSHWPD